MRSLTKSESQCPQCNRVFSSDSNCEAHKRWHGKGDGAWLECRSPADVELEAFERRGLEVWGPRGFADLERARLATLSEHRYG